MLDVENKDWSDVDLNWGVPRWNMSAQLVEAWSSVGVCSSMKRERVKLWAPKKFSA